MLRRTCASAMVPLALLIVATTDAGACCSQRAFVSSHGNDANPCTLALPCRGFAAAIAQTVSGGEVVVLDSAGYGIVNITQSVSITAPAGIYAGISVLNGQTGVVVNGAGINVVLHGLTINGASPGAILGVHFAQGARLRLESCVVSNLPSVGILQDASGSEMSLVDTVVRDNGAEGVKTHADATVLLDGVRLEHNAGDGLQVQAVAGDAVAVVRNSVSSFNGQGGIAALRESSPTIVDLTVESSTLANNAGDGIFAGGIADGYVYVALSRNTLTRNGLSGVSIYDGSGATGQPVWGTFAENQFSRNNTADVKVDGFSTSIHLSENSFTTPFGGLTWLLANSGHLETYQNNSGHYAGSGGTLHAVPAW